MLMKISKRITPPKGLTIRQEIRFGKPTVEGTRIAVADIINLLEAGYAIKEIPEQYPNITLPKAKKALRYAADILGKEETMQLA